MNVMRKLLSTMCAVLLTTLISGTTAHAEWHISPMFTDERFVGDMNNDGAIDASDASAILSTYSDLSIGKETNVSKDVADVNHDGAIDASDASKVLGIYSELSVGQQTALEVVCKELDENNYSTNDLIQFKGVSWYIHTDTNLNNNNIYLPKNTLNPDDVFYVVENCGNDWYGVFVDMTKTKVYVLIQSDHKDYFKKIGYVVWTENITQGENSTTTTTTTSAATATTSEIVTTTTEEPKTTAEVSPETTSTTISNLKTTSTTTTTTINTTTVTTSQTTSQETTTILTTTEDPYIDDYRHCLQAVKFIGISWNVRSSPETAANNVVDYLDYGDIFFVNRNLGNGWYSIILKNQKENFYVKIDDVNFVRLENSTAVVADSWNMRSTMDTGTTNNIVGTLQKEDMVVILETYSDGWQKVRTRKQEAYIYGKILKTRYNPFDVY